MITEIVVTLLFGFRTKVFIVLIILINFITHPLLNFIIQILYALKVDVNLYYIIPLEVAVIIVEWILLVYVFEKPKKKLLLLSFTMNTASFLAGIIAFWR